MSSAAKAELGALNINAREAIPLHHLLEEMGHLQPPMPIQIDNSTALGVIPNIFQPKQQSHGNEIPLVTLQNQSKTVPHILASRIDKHS
jgi:hypothetical protein